MSMVGAGTRILAWRVVQKAANAFTVLLAAKALGPVGQGHYALTMTIALVFASVLNGGVGLAAVPLLRRGEVAPRRALAAQALWSAVIAGLLILAAIVIPRSQVWPELTARLGWDVTTLIAAVVTVLAIMFFEVHTYDLLVAGRLVTGTLVGALRASAHLAVLGALTIAGRLDLQTAVISYAAVHAAAATALGAATWRALPVMVQASAPPAGPSAVRLAGRFLRLGWIGQLSAVSYLLLLRLDQGFLEFGHGAAAVGIYSIAVWAAEMLWLLPEAINPLLVHASADGRDPAARDAVAARAVRVALVLTAIGAALLAMIARPLFSVLLGGAYLDAVPALLALLPGTILLAPGAVLAGDFIGRGRPAWNTQASVVTVAVNVVLCLLWIPSSAAVGAAWASTVAYGVGSLVMLMRFRQTTGIGWREFLGPRLRDFVR
jgi:O-antigen/teichoic acid export membrane protein